MTEPLPLIPAALADRMVGLAQREALWRGILTGAASVLLLALILLAVFLWPARARAQSIPDEAYRFKRDIVRAGQHVWGLNAPTAMFAAQIHQESRFRSDARSPVGAVGLAQFMPSSSRWIAGVYPDLSENAPTTPEWSVLALVRYDKWLFDRLTGASDCHRISKAIASYNQGIGWTYRAEKIAPDPTRWFNGIDQVNPGKRPDLQRETVNYVRRIVIVLTPIYVRSGFGGSYCD